MERLKFKDLFTKVPRGYKNLTAREFQNIFTGWKEDLAKPEEERDFCNLFRALTGLTIANPSPETQTAVEELLSWVVDEPVPYTKEFPQTLYVEGRTVKLPRVVGSLTYGQNVMVKQALDGAKYYEEILVLATAIYIQQAFDESEKFIPSRARELALVLERYPAQLIYPIGFFTVSLVARNGKPRRNFLPGRAGKFLKRLTTSWSIS